MEITAVTVWGELSLRSLINRTNKVQEGISPFKGFIGKGPKSPFKMFKTIPVFLAIVATAFSAEISSSYATLEKHAVFNPDLKTEPVEAHVIKGIDSEAEHPVFKLNEVKNQGRARIETVRSFGPVIKHDAMLADQPVPSTEVNRNDDAANGYIPGTAEVQYPDILYAPGYLYDTGYPPSNSYDMNGANSLMEPDTSTLSLLWSQVPYGRTMVGAVGRTIAWMFNSIFVLILGSLITIGVCSYTNLCTIAFHGIGPINEQMRSLITPDKLEKISNAADLVKTAINKYQDIQKVTEANGMRRRRSIFNY